MTVTLTDGRQSTHTRESHRGDFLQPFAEAELRGKFRELAGVVLTPEGVTRVEHAVDRSEHWTSLGDLTELLGNILDNACKWCRSRVRLTAGSDESADPRERLSLVMEDDGPGISEADRARVLERGVRADQNVPGHGLGLAMVHDTVDLYGGRLSIDTSPLGGARVTVRLAGR